MRENDRGSRHISVLIRVMVVGKKARNNMRNILS